MMKTKNYLIKLLVLEINMVHDSYDTAYFDKDLLLFESEATIVYDKFNN